MDVIATYSDEHSLQLAEGALRKLGIPYELHKLDGELPTAEVMVSPEHFDKACDVVEKLDEFLNEKANAERNPRMCRNCGSTDLRLRDDFDPDESTTGIVCIFECACCGHLTPE